MTGPIAAAVAAAFITAEFISPSASRHAPSRAVPPTQSASLTAARFTAPPPDPLAPAIKAALSADGVKVTAGDMSWDVWWVNVLPTTSGSQGWEGVAAGALVGALRASAAFREIRGKTVKPGVYTLRFALQPQNGDHLGASPFREFLLLSPASLDTDAKALGVDPTNALSKQTIGASHPAALSLDPPVAGAEAVLSLHTSELGHKGIIFEVPTAGADGKSTGALKFGVILVGVITP